MKIKKFFKEHLRLCIIIGAVLLALLLIIVVFHDSTVSCVSNNFGVYCAHCGLHYRNEAGCSIFGANQKGISVSNKCVEFEWYPLFFGCSTGHYKSYDNCDAPVVCGVDLFALNCVDTHRDYYYPEDTRLPIKMEGRNIVEGEDFVVKNLIFTVIDRNGATYSSSNYEDILNSSVYQKIKEESYSLSSISNNYRFALNVSYQIETRYECDIKSEVVLIQETYYNQTYYESANTNLTTCNGVNDVTLTLTLDYIDSRYGTQSVKIKNEGQIISYSLGEN